MPDRWIYDEISNNWKADYDNVATAAPVKRRPTWLPYPYSVKQLPKMRTRDIRELFYHYMRTDAGSRHRTNQAATNALNRLIQAELPDFSPLHQCVDCEIPISALDEREPEPGVYVDQDCFTSRWRECPHCNQSRRRMHMMATGESIYVCTSCLESENYAMCAECNRYFHPNTGHNHPQCCESPQQLFTIRNDGQDPLANDTRVAIEFAEKRIDEEGIERIYRLLRDSDIYGMRACAAIVREMDPRWQMKTGNFTKRLSSNCWKTYHIKLPPEIISQVGNIAAQHTAQAGSLEIEITRDINKPARDFGNAGSCWWNGYSASRCALKSNGGFGLRTFTPGTDEVTGRAWVLPLRHTPNARDYRFQPTFDTMTPDAFIVFNGYHALSGYAPARLMAHMMGATYKQLGFSVDGMYINNSSGYLVGPEDLLASTYDVRLSTRQHSDLYRREIR